MTPSTSIADPDVRTGPVGSPASPDAPTGLSVVVAATYTAEPIEGPMLFWLRELGFDGKVAFAPYNQVIQQLLDPSSEFGRNDASGINLALVRPEDWARYRPGGWDEAAVRAGGAELVEGLRSFAGRSGTPTIVAFPPASPKVSGDPSRLGVVAEVEGLVREGLAGFDSVHVLGPSEVSIYAVEDGHDDAGDRVGHIPYTPLATSALATAVARRVHAIKSPPYKVIALDCDNTIWKGVVGEDGPLGVGLGPGMKAFQEFVVAQQGAGMVVCLVSKNAEADVLEALDLRDDFPLRRDHLVAWRIGWGAKSVALVELAEELNLGLDSFIFVDDNPVECAEVRAALPQVLTIQAPPDEGMAELLRHSWAFDRLKVTEEDRKRTRMYRLNADRARHESTAGGDIAAFLASLDLKIDVEPPTDDEVPRVAQLTQRTNQFNASTRRRTEAEVRQLGREGLEALRVDVSDRFGEYGLVGLAIFGPKPEADALDVDTILLSCRVLGRGVEHALLARLGRVAVDRGLGWVEVRHVPTAKNEPALNFLRSIGGEASPNPDGSTTFRVAAGVAAGVAYRPGADAQDQLELARTGGKKKPAAGPSAGGVAAVDKSTRYARIAGELSDPGAILAAVEAGAMTSRGVDTPFVDPRTAIEREVAGLWRRALHVDRVGALDRFDDLGGTSLKAARLFALVEEQFGIRLPMTTLLDAPTLAQLADRIATHGRGEARESLRVLRPGAPGTPALYLVHDGDGEVLLYLNLARRMAEGLPVVGIEPKGSDRCPTTLTTIPEMASYYVSRVVEAQPEGPYLVGGMCAGGTIAFEMARQLAEGGREVGLVALLDAADTRARMPANRMIRERFGRLVAMLRGRPNPPPVLISPTPADLAAPEGPHDAIIDGAGEPAGEAPGPLAKLALLATKARNMVAYERDKRANLRRDDALVRELRALSRRETLPEGYAGPKFRTVFKHAERAFESPGTLKVPVMLVRAGGDGLTHVGDGPIRQIFEDPMFGWERRVEGGADAIDVPGGHGGMLQEPNAESIARPLREAIARALSPGAAADAKGGARP